MYLDIVLASKSPRRSELLTQIGVNFRCVISEEEEKITKAIPSEVVLELSEIKAHNVENKLTSTDCKNQKDILIIGADTLVAYKDRILGKPKDRTDAFSMIKLLQGKEHQVYTGVTVIYISNGNHIKFSFVEETKVYMNQIKAKDIVRYIETKEPMDKAGAYAIQGMFAVNIKKIDGDYNNVVGLPVSRLYREVYERLGINMVTKDKRTCVEDNSNISACIFDLDGTILDTLESIGVTVNKVICELGFMKHPICAYKNFAGDGQNELIKRALIAAGDNNLNMYERAMSRYIELFKDNCNYNVKPYDGIKELLDNLKINNIKIAILSNKQDNNVKKLIGEIFGDDYFDYVLGQREDHERKPSNQGVDIIISNLGVDRNSCLYIGDTSTDMLTGKNSRMLTVGVTWGFREREELIANGADIIVNKPCELLEITN